MFGKLDMLQGYRQCPLSVEVQEVFTIATPRGLCTPLRVPQAVLNATGYYQDVLSQLLDGLDCEVWVDDVVFSGHGPMELIDTLDEIIARLEDAGLFEAAHK